jgi:hypothetical protein
MPCMVFIRVSILAMLSGCAMLSADTATIGIAGGSVAGDQKTSATKDSDKWNESKMDHDRFPSGLSNVGISMPKRFLSTVIFCLD